MSESNIKIFNMEEFKVITQDYVNVQISTSKDSVPITEKRFQRGIKVMELKVNPTHFIQ